MKPRTFPEANVVYRKPNSGIADLPCQRVKPGMIRSIWELDPAERGAVAAGADVELWIMTEPIPPVGLQVSDPKAISLVERKPTELHCSVELLEQLFREGGLRSFSVKPGPAQEARIVNVRWEGDRVVFEYDRPVEEPAFRVESH